MPLLAALTKIPLIFIFIDLPVVDLGLDFQLVSKVNSGEEVNETEEPMRA